MLRVVPVAVTIIAILVLNGAPAWAQVATETSKHGAVLVLGDSIMAWNGDVGASVAARMRALGSAHVTDRSVPGSRILAESDAIAKQYRPGPWTWVIVQGGGNDLVEDCACGACNATIDQLVGADGTTGAIADLVTRILRDGAAVMLWSYYEPLASAPFPFDRCGNVLEEVRARLDRLATRHERVVLLDGRDVIDPGRPDAYDRDGVHPSPHGSDAIARQIMHALRRHENRNPR